MRGGEDWRNDEERREHTELNQPPSLLHLSCSQTSSGRTRADKLRKKKMSVCVDLVE